MWTFHFSFKDQKTKTERKKTLDLVNAEFENNSDIKTHLNSNSDDWHQFPLASI